MLGLLFNLKIRHKFLAIFGVQALASLIVLIAALAALGTAKAPQSAAVATSLRNSQFTLVILVLILGGLAYWLSCRVVKRIEVEAEVLARTADALSNGDLTVSCPVTSKDELGSIGLLLNQAVVAIRNDVEAIALIGERTASGTTQLSATASQVDTATQEISVGADEQRKEVEDATQAINQIATTLSAIREGIQADVRQIDSMLGVSQTRFRNVEESTRAMEAIRESSTKVSAITNVIAEIALLIQESFSRVETGASSVRTVHDGLDTLVRNIQKQAEGAKGALAAVQEQVAVTGVARDRMANTLQITESSASATHELSAAMSETARTIDDLANTAGELRNLTRRFKLS